MIPFLAVPTMIPMIVPITSIVLLLLLPPLPLFLLLFNIIPGMVSSCRCFQSRWCACERASQDHPKHGQNLLTFAPQRISRSMLERPSVLLSMLSFNSFLLLFFTGDREQLFLLTCHGMREFKPGWVKECSAFGYI